VFQTLVLLPDLPTYAGFIAAVLRNRPIPSGDVRM